MNVGEIKGYVPDNKYIPTIDLAEPITTKPARPALRKVVDVGASLGAGIGIMVMLFGACVFAFAAQAGA